MFTSPLQRDACFVGGIACHYNSCMEQVSGTHGMTSAAILYRFKSLVWAPPGSTSERCAQMICESGILIPDIGAATRLQQAARLLPGGLQPISLMAFKI